MAYAYFWYVVIQERQKTLSPKMTIRLTGKTAVCICKYVCYCLIHQKGQILIHLKLLKIGEHVFNLRRTPMTRSRQQIQFLKFGLLSSFACFQWPIYFSHLVLIYIIEVCSNQTSVFHHFGLRFMISTPPPRLILPSITSLRIFLFLWLPSHLCMQMDLHFTRSGKLTKFVSPIYSLIFLILIEIGGWGFQDRVFFLISNFHIAGGISNIDTK